MTARVGQVLVVDDNEMNRDLVARRLLRLGHEVVHADGGRRALELLKERPFDLVLLDLMMPDVSGHQVLSKMKTDESLRHIPVLMISAASDIESVVQCIELGAEDYLPKPFKPALLNARVTACLEKKWHRDQEKEIVIQLAEEKRRSEELLRVILPGPIVEELKLTNHVKPRSYENVAILFADIVSFTDFCHSQPPELVVDYLQQIVHAFEDLALQYGIQKIKTIGDSFMCAGGLLTPLDNPSAAAVMCGLDMIRATEALPSAWKVRVGVHVGPVVGGIVGHRQYLFDVWGDTVNTASRLEHLGKPNSVTVSQEIWEKVKNDYQAESREVEVRGKGMLKVYDISPAAIAAPR